MKRKAATPFDQLLGLAPRQLPATPSVTVVVAGQRVDTVAQIDGALVDADRDDDHAIAEARRLGKHLRRAKARASDKRYLSDPANKARRQDWIKRHPERMAEYRAAHRERHREQIRKDAAEHFKRMYYADIEASRAKGRAYYHANRERILEQTRARKAAKAAKPAGEGQPA